MKTLHDGTEVSDDTPTKNVSGERYLLTSKEISDRQKDEAKYIAARQKYEAEEKYKDLRRAELAPLDGEGMDAMRKAIESLADFLVTDLPPEYQAYVSKVEAIKTKHPKPQK